MCYICFFVFGDLKKKWGVENNFKNLDFKFYVYMVIKFFMNFIISSFWLFIVKGKLVKYDKFNDLGII